ncbi:MAG: toll/interleukin-1 receptor domain-containing protein [Acidobacteriaceae bacterium]|nr:toll/interleukin-1 receptor domain-containing protein [Acidobacteriaceae bacterium]
MAINASQAFVSYSRVDSEFALRLAEDLKAGGANVWLDQLDIEPGTPWDRAVEDALQQSPCVLVVLSDVSVQSDNVRDEMSFALGRQKKVIPVLYRDCDVPFRLARLQYVDFRADYSRGLKMLLKVLAGNQNVVEPPASTPPEAVQIGSAMEVGNHPISEPPAWHGVTAGGSGKKGDDSKPGESNAPPITRREAAAQSAAGKKTDSGAMEPEIRIEEQPVGVAVSSAALHARATHRANSSQNKPESKRSGVFSRFPYWVRVTLYSLLVLLVNLIALRMLVAHYTYPPLSIAVLQYSLEGLALSCGLMFFKSRVYAGRILLLTLGVWLLAGGLAAGFREVLGFAPRSVLMGIFLAIPPTTAGATTGAISAYFLGERLRKGIIVGALCFAVPYISSLLIYDATLSFAVSRFFVFLNPGIETGAFLWCVRNWGSQGSAPPIKSSQ